MEEPTKESKIADEKEIEVQSQSSIKNDDNCIKVKQQSKAISAIKRKPANLLAGSLKRQKNWS